MNNLTVDTMRTTNQKIKNLYALEFFNFLVFIQNLCRTRPILKVKTTNTISKILNLSAICSRQHTLNFFFIPTLCFLVMLSRLFPLFNAAHWIVDSHLYVIWLCVSFTQWFLLLVQRKVGSRAKRMCFTLIWYAGFLFKSLGSTLWYEYSSKCLQSYHVFAKNVASLFHLMRMNRNCNMRTSDLISIAF